MRRCTSSSLAGFSSCYGRLPIEAWLNADHSLPMPAPSKEVTESRFTPSSLFLISITFTRASTFPRTSGSCGIEQSRRHCVVASFGESGSILSAEFIYSPHFVEYTNTTMDSTPPRLMSAVQYVYRGNLWEAQHKLRLLAFKITNPEINTARRLAARGRIDRVKQPGDSDRRRGSSGPLASSWS